MTEDRADKDSCKAYEVGRGRPPKDTRWKKGQSGNPSGPKKNRLTKTALREQAVQVLFEPVTLRSPDGTSKREVSKLQALLIEICNRAIKGDPRAAKMLFDYVETLAVDDHEPGPSTESAAEDDEILKRALDAAARRTSTRETGSQQCQTTGSEVLNDERPEDDE